MNIIEKIIKMNELYNIAMAYSDDLSRELSAKTDKCDIDIYCVSNDEIFAGLIFEKNLVHYSNNQLQKIFDEVNPVLPEGVYFEISDRSDYLYESRYNILSTEYDLKDGALHKRIFNKR